MKITKAPDKLETFLVNLSRAVMHNTPLSVIMGTTGEGAAAYAVCYRPLRGQVVICSNELAEALELKVAIVDGIPYIVGLDIDGFAAQLSELFYGKSHYLGMRAVRSTKVTRWDVTFDSVEIMDIVVEIGVQSRRWNKDHDSNHPERAKRAPLPREWDKAYRATGAIC